MSTTPPAMTPEQEERTHAALDMVRRTGATSTDIRWSDDQQPVVWMAVSTHYIDPVTHMPTAGPRTGVAHHQVAAALDPLTALLRLCEQLMDGGMCAHCHRPTGFEPTDTGTMPLADTFCWTQYDPELKTYRRGCEGS